MTKTLVHVGPIIQVRYKIGINFQMNAVYMQLENSFPYMNSLNSQAVNFNSVTYVTYVINDCVP